MHHPPQCLGNLSSDGIAALTSGMVVTDSTNLYDKLNKNTPVVKGAECRADIEALTLKESSNQSGMVLRWAHSDAQLANSLTKPTEKHQVQLFVRLGHRWRIIYDDQMVSARRRKSQGIGPMDDG